MRTRLVYTPAPRQSSADDVEKCKMRALKTTLRGGNNLEHKRKLDNFDATACFTITASRTDALPERVWVFIGGKCL